MQRQERGRKEPSEFNVIVKCKDLIKHTFTITNSTERFPKKYRFTLVNRIQDKAVDIYECALEANELNLLDAQEFKERQRLQAKAMTYCKELLFFIELSHEQGFISTNSCEYWSKLALEKTRLFNIRFAITCLNRSLQDHSSRTTTLRK